MVKGVSKQVVVVKPPQGLFEEAIFILKEDAVHRVGVNAEQVLREACAVANEYVAENCEKRRVRIPEAVFFAVGAGMIGMLWLFCSIL